MRHAATNGVASALRSSGPDASPSPGLTTPSCLAPVKWARIVFREETMSGLQSPRERVQPVRNLIAGRWELSPSTHYGDVFNPSTGNVIASVPMSTAADVD